MIIREIKTTTIAPYSVCDNEISNDISRGNREWAYEEGQIICCAVFFGDIITVIFMEKGDDLEEYKNELRKMLDKHPVLHAFNRRMEFGNFKGFLGKGYDIKEIKPFSGKGFSKQKFFMELVNDGIVKKEEIPIDPLEDDSRLCISRYAEGDYESIIAHNIADVIKQNFILFNKGYILKKYKGKINADGWFITE
jgi:hypothetical protein